MTRVVVAGAGGYVGGRLVAELLARPAVEVVALVRTPRPWLAVEQRCLDLRTPGDELAAALQGADAVVHLAGPSEVHAAAHPDRVLADTVAITANLGRAGVDVGRFVYLSTTHVYGARVVPGATLTEDLRPEPRHPYAIARLASEHALFAEHDDVVALRLTNSVGAPAAPDVDRWSLVVNDLCRAAATGGPLRLRTDGTQWRDFVALRDAARITADIALGAARPGVWNLASGRPATVRSVAELVADAFADLTGDRPVLDAPPPSHPPSDPPIVDASGLATFGLACATPLAEAVAETARFCWEHRRELAGWPAHG